LTLTGSNTYTGATTINSGTLQIGNGGSAGTLGAGAVVDNGTLVFNRSDNIAVSNVISGAGLIVKNNSNEVNLTGANTFSGTISISNGKLALNNASATGTPKIYLTGGFLSLGSAFSGGTATISELSGTGGTINAIYGGANDTRTLNVNQSTNTTFAGILGAATAARYLALMKSGSGTLTLTGNNANEGVTTISGGALQIGNGGTTGTLGAGNVVDNASLIFNRSDSSYAVSNIISGTGSLAQAGSGVLTLSGVNTYTGATYVNAGTLALASAGSLVSATLAFGGSSAASAVFDVTAKAANYSLATVYGVGTVVLDSGKTLTLTGALNHVGTDALAISGGLTLAASVSNTYEINLAADAFDFTNVTGTLNYNNTTLTIAFSGAKTTAGVYAFDILDFTAESGVANVAYSGLTSGESAVYDATTGIVTLTVVPEPSTLALLAVALGLSVLAWRKRRK
jgi:fibronectin-binding autotransporter adhesin